MKLTYLIIALSVTLSAREAPTTPIVIDNQSRCALTFIYKQEQTAQLTLPDKVAINSTESGTISFSNGFFAPPQQQAQGQYLAVCGHSQHLLSLDFFVGHGHLSAPDYFFSANHDANTPFLVAPYGKTVIKQAEPLIIVILDKEKSHEEPIEDTDTTLHEHQSSNNDNGEDFFSEQE